MSQQAYNGERWESLESQPALTVIEGVPQPADLDRDFSAIRQRVGQYALDHARQQTYNADDQTGDFLNSLSRFPVLTADEEIVLAKVIERGREARDANPNERTAVFHAKQAETAITLFMECNIKLVVSVAKIFNWSEIPLLDRIDIGSLGLKHAIGKFDWRRGNKFSTYATWWIRQSIGREVEQSEYLVRLPSHFRQHIRQIAKARREYAAAHGTEASLEALAEGTGIPAQDIEHILNTFLNASNILSIDAPVGEAQDTTLGEIIHSSGDNEVDRNVTDIANLESVKLAMSALDDREKLLVYMRYFEGAAFSDIADAIGVNESRARTIERHAIRKMREVINPQRGDASYG